MILREATRSELISKSKDKKRWKSKDNCSIANTVADYNSISMDDLFKNDYLIFDVKVQGETDIYDVKVAFRHILKEIQFQIKTHDNKMDAGIIYQALQRTINSGNMYISCSCLHPNTKIKLLDGTNPTVSEMKVRFDNGEKLWVYSTDKNGDFKPGEVEKVWITKTTKEFTKITLDSGEEILTTPDHLYMIRNGNYIEASKLQAGQSLMPMYFNASNGYQTVKLNSEERGWRAVYKLVAENLKATEIVEAEKRVRPEDNMSYKVAIHHKDFNKNNNNPDNLQIMTAREHWDYHNSCLFENKPKEVQEAIREKSRETAKRNWEAGVYDTPAVEEAHQKFLQKGWENANFRNHDPECLKKQAELMRNTMKNYYENLSEEKAQELHDVRSKNSKNAWERGCFDTDKFKAAREEASKKLHTPEMEEKIHKGVLRYWDNITPEEKEKRDQICKINISKATAAVKGTHWTEEHKRHMRETIKKRTPEEKATIQSKRKETVDKWTPEQKQAAVWNNKKTRILRNLNDLLSRNLSLTPENFEANRRSGDAHYYKYFKTFEEMLDYFNFHDKYNHKVVKVETIYIEDTPVYDIKVKKWGNFTLNAGVVVHNCPDFNFRFRYWASKNDYNSGTKEVRASSITNPDDDKGAGCKHIMLVLSNLKWLTKISSVIANYINYAKEHMERAYADIIFPAVYGMKYTKAVQLTLDDYDEEGELKNDLDSDPALINLSNALGKVRGRFKKKTERP